MGQIISAISAVWEILKLARSILDFIEANKNEQWFQDSAKVFTELNKAKTPEERRNAAKNIRDLMRGI